MLRKGNKCHAINNAIFLNKIQTEKSRKSQNERFTLSTSNFRTVGFPLALAQTLQVLTSSCLPQQIFNFSSNLFTRFDKSSQRIRFSFPNLQEILAIMIIASGEINLQSELSHLIQPKNIFFTH